MKGGKFVIERIYVEIGNICNLSCSFCPKTKRKKHQMTESEFDHVCSEVSKHTENIYLHVMGEPLLHPNLSLFLDTVGHYGMRASITTNGTLISEKEEVLLSKSENIHKICISLHSLEGNGKEEIMEEYLESACAFAKRAAKKDIFIVFRLWNGDSEWGNGKNIQNGLIERKLKEIFNEEWQRRRNGYRLDRYIFLEYDGVFEWPSESTAEREEKGRCHGLFDQIGVLADGSVVPCCLDADGDITLGNIFENTLSSILDGERASRMREGFKSGILTEELCKTCSYRRRFTK